MFSLLVWPKVITLSGFYCIVYADNKNYKITMINMCSWPAIKPINLEAKTYLKHLFIFNNLGPVPVNLWQAQ